MFFVAIYRYIDHVFAHDRETLKWFDTSISHSEIVVIAINRADLLYELINSMYLLIA